MKMENCIEVYPTYDGLTVEEAFARGLKPYLADITESRTKRLCVWARDKDSAREAVESMNRGYFIEFAPCDDNNDWIEILDDSVEESDIEFYDNCVHEDDVSEQERQEVNGKGFRISFQGLRRGDLKISEISINYGWDIVASVLCYRNPGELLGIPDYIGQKSDDIKRVYIKYGTDAYRDVNAEFEIVYPVNEYLNRTITIPIELSGDDKGFLWDLLREELEKRHDMTVNQFVVSECKERKENENAEGFPLMTEEEME